MATARTHTLLEAALTYAARGFHVLPLHGKHPRLDDWPNAASTDPAQIRAWWQQWPTANVGILTGARSGLAVLDVDPRHGGAVALEELLAQHGPLPETPLVLTGGGGQHYYFRLEADLPGCKPAPGLDLQLSGQQVAAPPSLHPSGQHYTWEASSDLAEVPLAPLPAWLQAMAEAKATASTHGVPLPDVLPVVQLQDLTVSPRLKFVILTGTDPDNATRYQSRSEALFAVLGALVDAGYDDATMAGVVLDRRYAISAKVWDQKNPKSPRYVEQTRAWLAKEIGRARAKALPDASARTVPDMTQDAAQRRNGDTRHPALITTCAADVTPAPVQWLWEPYIALGTLCMLDGDPGIGKSLLMLQIAANISQGLPFPDQSGAPTLGTDEPANVLIMTREDSLAQTIRPRLDASKADVNRVFLSANWLDAEGKEQAFTLKHLPLLEAELARLAPRLVVLDPIQSFFGDADMHRANQTRPLLDALAALAEQYGCAIVCIRHPAKPGEGIGKALHRGLGSVDIIGTARTGLFIEQYPGDETQALMCQTKNNLGLKGRTQIFSKSEGLFTWVRVSRLTDEDLAGSGRGPNHRAFLEAVLWLEQRLEGGLVCNATDIEAEAELQDISSTLLKRAKKALGVVSAQIKGEAHAGWTWRLPPLSLPPTRTPPTDPSDSTDSTDSTDTPDLKSTTYKEVMVRESVESDAPEGSEGSVDGVVTDPPCAICGGGERWQDGPVKRCVVCYPPAPERRP